jgi:hypothetical protein
MRKIIYSVLLLGLLTDSAFAMGLSFKDKQEEMRAQIKANGENLKDFESCIEKATTVNKLNDCHENHKKALPNLNLSNDKVTKYNGDVK